MNVVETGMTWERSSDNKVVECKIRGGVTFDFSTMSLRLDSRASAELQEQLKDGEFFLTNLGTTVWRTFAEIELASPAEIQAASKRKLKAEKLRS